MKKAIAVMMLLGGSVFAAPRVTVGIGVGAPVVVVRPACPGPRLCLGGWLPRAERRAGRRLLGTACGRVRHLAFWPGAGIRSRLRPLPKIRIKDLPHSAERFVQCARDGRVRHSASAKPSYLRFGLDDVFGHGGRRARLRLTGVPSD